MSATTVRNLALLVIVLFAAVFALNWQRGQEQAEEEQLFPGLKERMGDITAITVTDAEGSVTIQREGERWIVPGKAGYAADTDTLRQVLLAIADARKVEQKTSNPDLYERLGVGDPAADDGGVLVSSAGLGDADFKLILGDAVQQEYRYVRIADQAESWLIDQNPDVPDDASGWLAQEIVDIDSSRIDAITVTHGDGETIHIHKDKEDMTNFTVDGIPEGRELSYPSVANGMATVLSNLTLEDVVADPGTVDEASTTTVFSTFDGLELRVVSSRKDDQTWITLAASAREPAANEDATAAPAEEETPPGESAAAPAGESAPAAPPGAAGAAGEGDDAVEEAEQVAEGDTTPADADKEAPDPHAEAAGINARVSGWRYRIADYKADQLTRRWDDLLKAAEE